MKTEPSLRKLYLMFLDDINEGKIPVAELQSIYIKAAQQLGKDRAAHALREGK